MCGIQQLRLVSKSGLPRAASVLASLPRLAEALRHRAEAAERKRVIDLQLAQYATASSQRVNALIKEAETLERVGNANFGWLLEYEERLRSLEPQLRDLLAQAIGATFAREDFARQAYHHYSNAVAAAGVLVRVGNGMGLVASHKPQVPAGVLDEFGYYVDHLRRAYDALAGLTNA